VEKNSGAEGLFLRNWPPDTWCRDNGHNVSWSEDQKLLRVVRELTEAPGHVVVAVVDNPVTGRHRKPRSRLFCDNDNSLKNKSWSSSVSSDGRLEDWLYYSSQ